MISPEGMVPASNVVHLTYNASGPGHYDALIISQRDQQDQFTSRLRVVPHFSSGETNSNLDALESQSTLSTKKVPISTPRKPCRCGEKINTNQKQKRQGTTKAGASASTNTVPVWAHAVVVDGAKANNVGETKGFLGTKNVEHRESEVKNSGIPWKRNDQDFPWKKMTKKSKILDWMSSSSLSCMLLSSMPTQRRMSKMTTAIFVTCLAK